ncbi:MAG: hypothetical protein ACU0FT_04190 [Paracoccus sp. (in: a-proteobacteria)]|uniref:hypothetical protein n=1 Tax=Paracoccus sp. TaxID=267 RepID=UPI004058E24A
MSGNLFFRPGHVVRFFEGEGSGTGGGDAAGAGEGGETPPPGGEGADTTAGGASWFEDQRFTDQREWLSAKGFKPDTDPLDAISRLSKIGQDADRRFGRPLDAVIDKPGKDQSIADWRKANADTFGLPAEASGYEIARPEGLEDGIAWNDDLAAKMQTLAFERGMAPDDVKAMTDMYAGYVADMSKGLDEEMKTAETKLNGELEKLWGKDTETRKTGARQAAGWLAEQAGLDADGIKSVVGLLSTGDPGQTAALKMFAALHEAMGDDKAIGLKNGAGGLAPSKEEAMAAYQKFTAPDSEWAKASASGDTEAIARLRPEIDRLARAATAR